MLTVQRQRKNSENYTERSADFIYKNDLDKTCFQHDMAYGKYKDLNRRTQSDKVLKVKMQVNQNMMVIK